MKIFLQIFEYLKRLFDLMGFVNNIELSFIREREKKRNEFIHSILKSISYIIISIQTFIRYLEEKKSDTRTK
jgi:hypothetical protein